MMTPLKLSVFSLLLLLCYPFSALTQEQCDIASTQYSTAVVESGKTLCCAKKSPKKQKKCFRSRMSGMKSTANVLSKEWTKEVASQLKAAMMAGCSTEATKTLTCEEEDGVTVAEALARIEQHACNLKFKNARQSRLQKLNRSLRKTKGLLDHKFVSRVKKGIRKLKRSKSCGAGGEEPKLGCSSIVDPRDGTNTGNVYKLGDHDGLPVFITHNGARGGSAIDQSGNVLDTLRYTGLANPDPQGPRHHYRLSRSCGSLPAGFLIKLGGTCYQINSPCSRID